jgi:hypothetical protein
VNALYFYYAAYVLVLVLYSEVLSRGLLHATFYNHRLQAEVHATPMIVVRYMLFKETVLIALFALASVMAIAVGAFLGYHLFLVTINNTTNENFKWTQVCSDCEC